MKGPGRRILIVGGYGVFGGRLARLLADEERAVLLIAGRSRESASAFCTRYRGRAEMLPCRFDRNGDLAAQLQSLSPDVIVDAAGPFQIYGSDPYALVRAALAQGAHYLDLADGSDFVSGISQFREEALERRLFALAGVSSFPVLSGAVVRSLLQPGDRPERVEAGLAPSPHADVGLNVMRAIASYAGKSIPITRNGALERADAILESRVLDIATPGQIPLGRFRFSLVDVPDLQLLCSVWPSLRDVWIGAAMKPAWMQRLLPVAALMVKWRIAPDLLPFASAMARLRRFFARGEHRGGMVLRTSGASSDGRAFSRSWHMNAPDDQGPFIPAMPAAVLIGRWLDGRSPQPGARAALCELGLGDFGPLFRAHGIEHGVRDDLVAQETPLYRRVLAGAFGQLPGALQNMHDRGRSGSASGRAEIDRGDGWLAGVIAAVVGFPPAGRDVPVTVTFTLQGGQEIWERNFGGRKFRSRQSAGQGASAGLINERFGPTTFGLAYVTGEGRAELLVRNWRLLGLPMPLWLAPSSRAFEREVEGIFHFHVEISHPLTGLIVRYRGALRPDEATCAVSSAS